MKKMKYAIILINCIQLSHISTKNIDVVIPPASLKIPWKTVEKYLKDTTEEKNDQNIEHKKKKYLLFSSLSLFKQRVRTLLLICKDYVDLQYTLLKEYVATAFNKI